MDGVTVLKPTVKAEVFADSLEQQFTLNPPAHASHDERIQRAIRTARDRPDNDENAIPTVTTDEIREIIVASDRRKAPGRDKITNMALKKLPENIFKYIKFLYVDILYFINL